MDNKIAQRFWEKVLIGDGCWEWQGCLASGYGKFRLGKMLSAHRVAYELWYGHAPADGCVLHLCDNPKCCRPDHLMLGDQAENMRQMVERGRNRSGSNLLH